MRNDEKAVTGSLDHSAMWKHLEYLSSLDKLSGSPGAARASAYILEQLSICGIPGREERFEEYLSNPLESRLVLEDGTAFRSRPRSFSADCPQGVEGELVFDPNNRDHEMTDEQWERLLESFRGKIVVSHGYDERYAKLLERHGAAAWIQVWGSGEEVIHEDTASGVWGTPTIDTSLLTPCIPIIGVSGPDGEALQERISRGPVRAKLISRVETGVFPVVMPVAEIPGRSREFVLISCHYDSWFLGAMDNCTANAAAIEIARAFWKRRGELERGIRIVWYAGHSNGRYAGSTWYCDNHWRELHDHCVAHITSDLTGSKYGSQVGAHTTGAEGREYLRSAAAVAAPGAEVRFFGIGRGADQSFWGTGIPFHFYTRHIRPDSEKDSAAPGPGVSWWHTAQDTLDKIDPQVYRKDSDLLFLSAYRLAAEKRLPFGGKEYFDAVDKVLAEADAASEAEFDFAEIRAALARLEAAATAALDAAGQDDEAGNRVVRLVCGGLNRLRQSYGSPYDHDLAFSASGIFPRLCCVQGKKREEMSPAQYLFLRTDFVRQRNRAIHQLDLLTEAVGGRHPKV